ncbi:MAG: sugar phosphate isomerase/epimerase [Thaumarchaeota archaeon]|nr:sugar phosphate isomerase/epimerase [Nitrososphaerota archaeon]
MVLKGFAITSWVWSSDFRSNDFEAFRKASEFGFDAIEILTMDGVLDSAEIRNVLNSTSPRLSPIITGAGSSQTDLTSDDVTITKNGSEYVKRLVKVCRELNGSLVCGPLSAPVGILQYLSAAEREKILQRVVLSFKDLGKYAQDFGVSIAIEPLCRYDTHLINTTAQATDLVDKIDRDNVGLLLDTFHLNIEEKSIKDAILKAGERLIHFHACENDRGTPGSGQINWDEVSDVLRTSGYDGWISIESFTPLEPNFSFATRVWRPLEPTQDEIAIKGLAFLKTIF